MFYFIELFNFSVNINKGVDDAIIVYIDSVEGI